MPLGDIVSDGKLINKGRYRNAIAMRDDGRVVFVRRKGRAFDWSGYRSALAAGPMLVRGGRIHLDPMGDGFRNMSLDLTASRSAVGLTREGKLLLVVWDGPIDLRAFAHYLLDSGCTDAMNLDGGPACALYHDGKTLVEPRLTMTNLLLVYKKPPRRPVGN